MSRKSRERREKNKAVRPDDYFSNGVFEMARFGRNTIVRNNRTPKQHLRRWSIYARNILPNTKKSRWK